MLYHEDSLRAMKILRINIMIGNRVIEYEFG
jgi:hypothetical protein